MNAKKNIQNTIFIIIIFIILISPLVYWLSLNGNWTEGSILEDRKLVAFPTLSFRDFKTAVKRIFQGLPGEAGEAFFNQFINGSFQRKVNKAAAEQMFLRIPLVEYAKFFDRIVIKSAYMALSDQAYPASLDVDLYVTRDGSNLLQDSLYFTEQERNAIDLRAANYQELLDKYPNIHFYVFNIETLPNSAYHPMATYFPQADSGQSLRYFLEHKPPELQFDNLALTSFEDYQEGFFRTDQHWKIKTSMEAYRQIYAMFSEQYPEINPMVEVDTYKKIEGLDFLGALARKTLYPVEADTLEYAEVDLMDYTTYIDGELADYGGRNNYLIGKYNQEKFYNHYRGFYGIAKTVIQYHFENETDRNLLMIISSHSRTIQMYLASHFRDTYVIDMRFEDNNTKSLQEFIDEYQITDVLIFGQPSVTYYSAEDAIIP